MDPRSESLRAGLGIPRRRRPGRHAPLPVYSEPERVRVGHFEEAACVIEGRRLWSVNVVAALLGRLTVAHYRAAAIKGLEPGERDWMFPTLPAATKGGPPKLVTPEGFRAIIERMDPRCPLVAAADAYLRRLGA